MSAEEAARCYAVRGFKVVPLHAVSGGRCSCGRKDCHSPGKHPRTKRGALDASAEEAMIHEWFRRWPDANLGLALDELVAVDVDPRNGGDLTLEALERERGELPETCAQRTGGGGAHLLYRARDGARYPGSLGRGVDLKRGPGAFIVVEPSVHLSGARYGWLDGSGPHEGGEPALAPEWFCQVNGAERGSDFGSAGDGTSIREGGRNEALSRIAFKLRKGGLGVAAIEAALLAENRERCSPPLPEAEVRDIARRKAAVTPAEAKPSEPALPAGETAFALLERDLPEPARLCDPWVVEGTNLIAGRPKLGKTTLLRQKAAALSGGGEFFGAPCKQTIALVLSLEEGARLMRRKLRALGLGDAALAGIVFHYEWPRGEEGVALLDRWLAAHPEVAYAAIDSLSKFRAVPDARTPAFIADYEAMSRLHEMTNRRAGLALDVVHHTRKARSDDPIDDISGTYGLTAACDSYVVLRRHEDGAVMHVGGRLWDRDESEFRLRRASNRWELLGEFRNLTAEQEDTLGRLRRSGGLASKDLADQLGIGRQSAWERLRTLVEKGVAEQTKGVFYAKTL